MHGLLENFCPTPIEVQILKNGIIKANAVFGEWDIFLCDDLLGYSADARGKKDKA
jgi:hypothetical protein